MGGAVSHAASASPLTRPAIASRIQMPGLPFGLTSTKNEFFSKYCFASPIDVLGEGGNSKVLKGHARCSGEAFAIKCIFMKDIAHGEPGIVREKNILMTLSHGHIIKLYDYYEDTANGWVWMVLELVSGGALFDRIQSKTFYNEKDARSSCLLLLDILAYLHDRDIAQ